MKVLNETQVYTASEVKMLYNGILPESKRRLMAYLEKDGYSFFVNNSAPTPTYEKWESFDFLLVAQSIYTPKFLWAVGSMKDDE